MTIPATITLCYPHTVPPKSNLLRTKEREFELKQMASELIGNSCILTEANLDFTKGSVVLGVEPVHNPHNQCASCILDVMTTRYFQEKKEALREINDHLITKLESLPDREYIEKITNIFYFALNNYLQENPGNKDVLDTTIAETWLGMKNPKMGRTEVMDLNDCWLNHAPKFKEFIQSLPTSILDTKKSKKVIPFVQKALAQKPSLEDKKLYLKQVIGFLLLEEVFKNTLQETKLSLAIEQQNLHFSKNRGPDLDLEISSHARRSERINDTLAKFPLNTILTLIPLACRSHPSELSDCDILSKDSESQHPFILTSDYIVQECKNARAADIALRQLLEEAFHVSPQSFLGKNDYFEMQDLESFLMGVSGLAIAPGSYARIPMHDHQTIYYKREGSFHTPAVSDNVLCEFLMTAAQFLFEEKCDWIENSCFAYLEQMMGSPTIYNLDQIKCTFQKIRDVVQTLEVKDLLKPDAQSGSYILRNSGLKGLISLHKEARKKCGLQPYPSNTTSSSCVIS